METNVNYTIVGAFVLSLMMAIILAIIWLSSGLTMEQYKTYLVYMNESVSGLSQDSTVEFNGVDIGAVKAINLNPRAPDQVEIELSVKSNTPVTMGTVATLKSKGITGITYVALTDKSDDMRPLLRQKGQKYPVIKSAPSLFTRIDTALNRLSKNLQEVAQSVQSVLDKENQQAIKETLRHLEEITGNLANNNERLTTILENTSHASKQLGPLLQSTSQTALTLERQTLPATYRLLNNLNEAARNMSAVAAEIKENPAMLIRGKQPNQLGPGESR